MTKHSPTFTEAIYIVLEAAAIRRDQWQALVDGECPSANNRSMTVGGMKMLGNMNTDPDNTEAQDIADRLDKAIKHIQRIYDAKAQQ
jgi:hypothetical protein